MLNRNFNVGSSDVLESKMYEFVSHQHDQRSSSITKKLDVLVDRADFLKFMDREYNVSEQYIRLQLNRASSGSVFTRDQKLMFEWRADYNIASITFMGNPERIQHEKEKVLKFFPEVDCQIKWVFSNDGNSISIPVTEKYKPVDEMYPFLGMPLADYFENFKNSDCSTLLTIGPPGTGKTSFIRGFLIHSRSDALLTYDEKILGNDYVFADFIEGKEQALIIEDADNFLRSRKEGNNMMQKFLNIGSGLVSNNTKKLIFSTNLESIDDIDPALIRPGRCFDVLSFRRLTTEEARILAVKIKSDVNLPFKHEGYTVAEVFNQKDIDNRVSYQEVNMKPKMGFV